MAGLRVAVGVGSAPTMVLSGDLLIRSNSEVTRREGLCMARDSSIPKGGQGPTSDLRGKVRHELDKLRELAQRVSIEEVRQGEWFARLLKFRREGDTWKVAHRRADPITTSRPITTVVET